MVTTQTTFSIGNCVLNTTLNKEGFIIRIYYINNEPSSYIIKYKDNTYGYAENKELNIIKSIEVPL